MTVSGPDTGMFGGGQAWPFDIDIAAVFNLQDQAPAQRNDIFDGPTYLNQIGVISQLGLKTLAYAVVFDTKGPEMENGAAPEIMWPVLIGVDPASSPNLPLMVCREIDAKRGVSLDCLSFGIVGDKDQDVRDPIVEVAHVAIHASNAA